ncbi:MAG: tRNA (adenosine(37)-N6)-dimethylallyltransferase MiaA [Rhizobiales bacterium]|nr:tRNA (adenosine(37)-N6)-dimethylallyltransferase MiaA [Hyphomicrobiales bacterium]
MVSLIIIGGPTGSGKSALALDLAERIGGAIVNADSMQQYRDLRIVTARPTLADHRRAPHYLYGHLSAEQPGSVGQWLRQATRVIDEIKSQERVPIVVGGTGLYLKGLLNGIANVPDVPSEIRIRTSERFDALGVPGFHQEFARHDPEQAALLEPGDRQRLIRAAEVLAATGRSMLYWRSQPHKRAVLPEPIVGVALMPPRAALHRRIEHRLQAMVEAGAIDELVALRAQNLSSDLPLMKAVAVPELLAHLNGRLDLGTAVQRAVAKTRQYAKRQMTWLRHQLPELEPMEGFGDSESSVIEPTAAVRLDLLTDLAIRHTVRSTR